MVLGSSPVAAALKLPLMIVFFQKYFIKKCKYAMNIGVAQIRALLKKLLKKVAFDISARSQNIYLRKAFVTVLWCIMMTP